jgi:hypothetical protein
MAGNPLPELPIGRSNPLRGCEGSGIFLAYSVFISAHVSPARCCGSVFRAMCSETILPYAYSVFISAHVSPARCRGSVLRAMCSETILPYAYSVIISAHIFPARCRGSVLRAMYSETIFPLWLLFHTASCLSNETISKSHHESFFLCTVIASFRIISAVPYSTLVSRAICAGFAPASAYSGRR